jgi:hypothetical protein
MLLPMVELYTIDYMSGITISIWLWSGIDLSFLKNFVFLFLLLDVWGFGAFYSAYFYHIAMVCCFSFQIF